MSETFERDVIDRLALIETVVEGMDTRIKRLEEAGNGHRLGSVAGGSVGAFIMAGVAVVLKLLGWL